MRRDPGWVRRAFFAQDFAGKPQGTGAGWCPLCAPTLKGCAQTHLKSSKLILSLLAERVRLLSWHCPRRGNAARCKDLVAPAWKGGCLRCSSCGSIPEDMGASPPPRALQGFGQRRGRHVRPQHTGCHAKFRRDDAFKQAKTMAVLPQAGSRIWPQDSTTRGDVCKPATCCLAILVKINESVVSQQGRKDLQTSARTGFGDANPPGGPN